MKNRNLVVVIAAVFLTACGTFTKIESPVNGVEPIPAVNPVIDVKPVVDDGPIVDVIPPVYSPSTIGQVEYVDILPEGIRQKARIDTGAKTTSIGVQDIQLFERDGKSWVKFKIQYGAGGEVTDFLKPIKRTVLIKRHGAENVRRPVVMMTLAIGSIEQRLEVSLADRSKFEYPVLIGRNFLDGNVSVDVSAKFLMLDK